jgi:hypothetical protein
MVHHDQLEEAKKLINRNRQFQTAKQITAKNIDLMLNTATKKNLYHVLIYLIFLLNFQYASFRMDVNNNLMVLLNPNNSVLDRLNDNHRNVMLVLVLYLNQQNVKEHHVHL